MSKHSAFLLAPVLCIASAPALAVQYLNIEQAQKLMFSEATRFSEQFITLTDAQKSAIQDAGGVRVRNKQIRAWRAYAGERLLGWFIVDEVVGKHEFITYALAITPQGTVRGLEVMDYRETHGDQIRRADWRKQFYGRSSKDRLELEEDIQNISGATLSCANVTNGVRRILATWDKVLHAG